MKILSTSLIKTIAGGLGKALIVTQKIPLNGVSEGCIQSLNEIPFLVQGVTNVVDRQGVNQILNNNLSTHCCSTDRDILLKNSDAPYLTAEYT